MTAVFAPPAEIGDPPSLTDFLSPKFDHAGYEAACEAYTQRIADAARAANPRCDIAGEVIRFPIADGYAEYVIWDTKSMIHLDLGDGYAIPEAHERGLRPKDLRDKVAQRRNREAIFGGKP